MAADLVGPTGRVAAVEPNPHICTLLRRSLAVNGFATHTTVLEQAATAVDDRPVTLRLIENEPKNAHLVPSVAGAVAATSRDLIMVRGGRLATALDHWPRLDFVKIDVEGAEEAAVEGLFPMLERHRPDVVLEFNPLRCATPAVLLAQLNELYGALAFVDIDGEAHPATVDTLLDPGVTQDWLIYLTRSA